MLRLVATFRGGAFLSLHRRLSTTVFGWGSNDAEELGTDFELEDQPVPTLLKNAKNAGSVSCGYGTTHFYKKSMPEIWSFGLNSLGQLGSKDHANNHMARLESNVVGIACGRAHTLVLTVTEVFAAGSNIQGQCGLKHDVKFSNGYQKLHLPFSASDIKQVCCGLDNSLILTKDGKVFASGLGADGQTGNGSYDCQYGFAQVAGDINSHNIIQISATTDTCLALSDDGFIFGWGNNEQGQISKNIDNKQIGVPMNMFCATSFPNVRQVFAGGSFSSILADGSIYVQGYGAIGLGPDKIDAHQYTKIKMEQSFGKIQMVSGSADYLAALTDAGYLLTWGRGNHGRLGHGNSEDCYYPKKVNLPGRVSAFSCGVDHMVAVVFA